MIKIKILLIDDDKELSQELAELLETEGYQVQIAGDGLAGENLIKSSHYDVILLDIKMPNLNGTDLLNRLRNFGYSGKIILVSGKPFLKKEIRKLGFLPMISGFVSKPFEVNRLLDTIQAA